MAAPALLGVRTPEQTTALQTSRGTQDSGSTPPDEYEGITDNLALHARRKWDQWRRSRHNNLLTEQLMKSLRAFNGQYDPDLLQKIREFGGSEAYVRIAAGKCRAMTATLRDVYNPGLDVIKVRPTPEPEMPQELTQHIATLLQHEVQAAERAGVQVDPGAVIARGNMLRTAAERAVRNKAKDQARHNERKLKDLLIEGGFGKALQQLLIDLPIYDFAVLKGPIVRMRERVKLVNGQPVRTFQPALEWERVSPFDLVWTPGASDIRDADTCERVRFSRARLNQYMDAPGYITQAIRNALDDYSKGLHEWFDAYDTERAFEEKKESPHQNVSELLDGLLYHGSIQGRQLLEYGIPESMIADPSRDYRAVVWIVGRWVIKVSLNANPNRAAPYYVTSYEKVPGAISGNGLMSLLSDIASVSNAVIRALVNNLSISSGPQVVIDDSRLDPDENDDIYPWKRWHVSGDPFSTTVNAREPVSFFQPQSNAQELLTVYESLYRMADEISGLPRYMAGSGSVGGAGRTASGLAMLMTNASKILKNVASNVDTDIIEPAVQDLNTMLLTVMSDPSLLSDSIVQVTGAATAERVETERVRRLEFLQQTLNPLDAQIMGMEGRSSLLREVADTLGMDKDSLIPDPDTLQARAAQIENGMPQNQNTNSPRPGSSPGAGEPRLNSLQSPASTG